MKAGDVVAYPDGVHHRVAEVEDDRLRLKCGRLTRERSGMHPRGVQASVLSLSDRRCRFCFQKER